MRCSSRCATLGEEQRLIHKSERAGRPGGAQTGRPRRGPDGLTPRKNARFGADLWISLALAAIVFAIYFQVRNFAFLDYDDPEFVIHNPHIRGGLTPPAIAWAFQTGYAANWFPLTWLSYMLGVDLYGLSSSWHHLTNVFLHALNTVLLFAALARLSGARWASAFAALLFAVHPLHVEAVAWVSQRRELLSGAFWLLSIWAYSRYAERPRAAAYLMLVAAFICGLMSKPTIVTLPFALLLLDYWPLRRWSSTPARRLILEKLPLVVLAAAGSVVTLLVQRSAGAVSSLGEVPFRLRFENALVSYAAYLFQFLWPARLAALYPYDTNTGAWQIIGAAILLASITWLAVSQRKRRPYFFVGWLWFLGTLVPMIGLVQVGVQSRADRYMYMPLVGLGMAAAWAVAEIASRRAWTRNAVAAVVCCAYAAVAWPTLTYWRDTVTLLRRAVEVTSNNWAAMLVLTHALLKEDRVDDAMPYITQALEIRPNLPEAHVNFGIALSKRGEFDAAAAQYRIALASDPGNADAKEGLGVVLTEKGQFAEAQADLNAVVKAKPEDADAHYNLGRLYGLAGRPDLAAAEFATAVSLKPEDAAARFNLGNAYASAGHFSEAAGQFRDALRLDPGYAAARFNRASALANLERWDEAIAEYQELLRRNPGYPGASEALAECVRLKANPSR